MQKIKKTILLTWLFWIYENIFSFLLLERMYFHINTYAQHTLACIAIFSSSGVKEIKNDLFHALCFWFGN